MTCRVCGCTDDRACVDKETGEPCYWVMSDLCSICADMLADMQDALDAGFSRPDGNEPRVALATEADLNELLRGRR
jgi:hypothetical protein